jgi:NADH:ubiquinone reductase (H+-translocating)
VILGGGFGGLFAARALDREPVRVTLLDRHNYHLFQPLLYQVATASLSPADVASPIRWVLRRQKNVEVLLADARAIDPVRRHVVLDPGPATRHRPASALGASARSGGDAPREGAGSTDPESIVAFDYLILATGATHSYFGHSDWAQWAPGLKTLNDALEMRQQILVAFEAAERTIDVEEQRRLLTFVIVGGGPTGVELAGALAEIARQSLRKDFRRIHPESAHILLLEGSPHLLGAFPESLRQSARRALERLGVDVRTNAQVVDVDAHGVLWRSTSAESPAQRIASETILWAAGVAASPLAQSLGVPLDRAGRITPAPTLAVSGAPGIFVAGDICAFSENGRPLPGVAQVAMQQGAHAARNIVRAIRNQPLEAFHYRDYGIMATIGRGSAVGDIFGLKISGFLAWLFWIFLHIFWLIGFRNRIAVMSEWAWAYITFQRRVRLITAEHVWQR